VKFRLASVPGSLAIIIFSVLENFLNGFFFDVPLQIPTLVQSNGKLLIFAEVGDSKH